MLFAIAVLLIAVGCLCNGTNVATPVAPTIAPVPTKAAAPTANLPQPPANNDNGSTTTNAGTSSDLVTFTDQNNLLAFDLPGNWTYVNTPGEKFYTDTFTSPDEAAKIESLVYNDGVAFSGKDNGKFALYLLNTFYSNTGQVGDIRISTDQIMQDGSERLEWTSKGGGYSGVSYFELRGDDRKTFLLFTAWWSDGADQTVLDAVNNAISSYNIP
jgi:hypothetical protein